MARSRHQRVYSMEQRQRILSEVARREADGISLERASLEAGVTSKTVRKWRRASAFEAVEIVASPAAISSTSLSVFDERSGLRVENMDLDGVAALIERLR
jgi:transposase-like protein